MDFAVGLPNSNSYTAILVLVDHLTKFTYFRALPTRFTVEYVARFFCDMVVKIHRFPYSFMFDHNLIFLSAFWGKMFEFSNTILKISSTYHPQTDGQTKVFNHYLEQYLRSYV